MFNFHKNSQGFTLVELMVVISIIGLLSTALYASFGESKALARDKVRMATMSEVQLALQLYKNQNGRYPEGCNGANRWSANVKSGIYKCTDPTKDFIIGLVPDFLPELPKDPLFDSSDDFQGYFYITNTDGSAYKFLSNNSLENTIIEVGDEYAKCPTNCPPPQSFASGSCTRQNTGSFDGTGLTEEELNDIYRRETNSTFQRSLGVYSVGEFACKSK